MSVQKSPESLDAELMALSALCHSFSAMSEAAVALGLPQPAIPDFMHRWQRATLALEAALCDRIEGAGGTPPEPL